MSITGEIPNLTRDAVETTIKNNLFESKIIDTAGFSKSKNDEDEINHLFTDQTRKKSKIIKNYSNFNGY